MNPVHYLPSAQFAVIAGSLMLAGGLVAGASYYTRDSAPSSLAAASGGSADAGWQAALEQVQAQAPGLPEPPDSGTILQLLDAAESSNFTDTVSRTLLVNLSAAGAEGLGSDAPTQDKLVEEALRHLATANVSLYASADFKVVADSPDAARAWGNGFITSFNRHPDASVARTIEVLTTSGDAKKLAEVGAEHRLLASELARLQVPSTLVPLNTSVVNNFVRMEGVYADIERIEVDPLRGLAGVQQYLVLADETGRLFVNIAEVLQRGGIIFSKEEPGSAWSVFLLDL